MDAAHANSQAKESAARQPVVLCVDDEENILSSLKRALRRQPFKVLTANGGEAALTLLAEQPVDLVISDMRMPNMNGAELLSKVREGWPDTVRILLTGYADMESTVSAINDGQIFRYLNKPWNNEDLTVAISSALEHKRLKDENAELTELTRRQNDQLLAFNDELERKVEDRTEALAQAHWELNYTFSELQRSYQRAIGVFAQLIELREGSVHHHSQKVADTSAAIGEALSLTQKELSDLANAAMLHDIGKLGLSDELVSKSYSVMTEEERKTYQTHPGIGQAALLSIPALENTGLIIRAHHEQYDGQGFPDRLSGDAIPLAARIIAVAADFDDLQRGLLLDKPLSESEALEYLKSKAGEHYDKRVVEVLLALVNDKKAGKSGAPDVYCVHVTDLKPGMRTAVNINADNGMLLLVAGQVITESLIDRINQCLNDTDGPTQIKVIREDNVRPLNATGDS